MRRGLDYATMSTSLFTHLLSRQHSPRRRITGHLWPVLEILQCHYNDEVVFYGGMTEAPVPVFVCKFSPDALYGNLLAAGDEEGSVRLMDTRRVTSQSLIKEFEAHRNAIFDIAWHPGATKLLSGSGDATVRQWDVVGGALLAEFRAHTASVKCIDVNMDEPNMFVSGGRDGSIHVWDTRCTKRGSQHRPVNSISAAHKKSNETARSAKKQQKRGRKSEGLYPTSVGDTKYSVTAVLFHDSHKIASCGTADGIVKLWDLRRTYTNSRLEPPPAWFTFEPITGNGKQYSFTSLVSGPYQSTLFASCTDNMCYMYNSAGLNKLPVSVFSGHRNSSFYVKSCVSPDGRYLLSGSSCGNAFIWQIDRPEVPPLMLTGHTKEVTAVAWCPSDLTKIVTCSDDNDLRLWKVVHGKKAPGEITGRCQPYLGNGHLKGVELLRQQYEKLSSKANQSRTPLHPVQQKSATKSTPTNVTILSKSLDRWSAHRITPDTSIASKHPAIADKQGAEMNTVLSITGNSESEGQDCHSECNNDRKLTIKSEDATASTSSHSKKHLHGQNSKQIIEQSPQPSPTCTNKEITGNSITPLTPAAVTMTTEVMEMDSTKTEVTPGRNALGCGSVTKRRLKLEEGSSCRPQTKRRRTSTRDSSGGQKKSVHVVKLHSLQSGQRTMQSYFQPA